MDPFGFTKITAPVYRDSCTITDFEMKFLALTIVSNIAEIIEEEYIDPYIKEHVNKDVCCIQDSIDNEDVVTVYDNEKFEIEGSLLEEIFHIDESEESYQIFDKYITSYIRNNISIKLFPLQELIAMLPRLMIYMQLIIHNLKWYTLEDKTDKDLVYSTLKDFDKYPEWTKDFSVILEYICNKYVNDVIDEYNKSIKEDTCNE